MWTPWWRRRRNGQFWAGIKVRWEEHLLEWAEGRRGVLVGIQSVRSWLAASWSWAGARWWHDAHHRASSRAAFCADPAAVEIGVRGRRGWSASISE